VLSVLNKHRYKIIAAVVIVVILCVAWTVGGGYAKDGADSGKDTTIQTTSDVGNGANNSNDNGGGNGVNNSGNDLGTSSLSADASGQSDVSGAAGSGQTASGGPAANNAANATDASDNQQNGAAQQNGGNAVELVTPIPSPIPDKNATEASQQSLQSTSPAENSTAQNSGTAQNSDSETDKGAYNTNPIPDGKPAPVEPQDAKISDTALTCTISVRCDTIINNMKYLNLEKHELVPEDGWILKPTTVTFYEGESVFNVLQREMRRARIHLEFSNVPIYNSAYIEGINNLYEFDVGELSGWMYKVNDWFPNFGSSRYQLMDGDVIAWVYTCDLGEDVGGGYAVGNR